MEIRHFVPKGWENDTSGFATELGFLSRVAYKVEQIRDDLGSVGSVLADQVGDAMLGKRTSIDDDAIDRVRSKPATKVLQVERKLREGEGAEYSIVSVSTVSTVSTGFGCGLGAAA